LDNFIYYKLSKNNHRVILYKNSYKLEYEIGLKRLKHILENNMITGYRNASRSLSFKKEYYQIAKNRYKYLLLYLLEKVCIHKNNINKKQLFVTYTNSKNKIKYPMIKKKLSKTTNNVITYIRSNKLLCFNLIKFTNININSLLTFYPISQFIKKFKIIIKKINLRPNRYFLKIEF
jgi:hypothetical protein